jgi:alcohol dehydrogenase
MASTWRFSSSDEIVFGTGAVAQLGGEAAGRGMRRALVVSDQRLIDAGVLAPVRASLEGAGVDVTVFAGGVPEPSDTVVDAAADAARACTPDVIIGLGGGSNMDVAKVAALVFSHGKTCRDYFGENQAPGPAVPVIAIPTTAGTGSEVTAVAVIEHSAKQLKLAVASPYLRPRLALLDPALTLSCPPRVTAESGMDALVHAVEALTVIEASALDVPAGTRQQFAGRFDVTDALAERAVRLCGQHLRNAVYQPKNLEAREGMLLAALLAGMAFSSAGLGAAHALQYPLGALTHTSHGLGTGLLLPYVVAYLLPANPQEFGRIARMLGEDEKPGRCFDAIQALKCDIGIPMRLRDIGVNESQLRPMAEQGIGYQRLLRMSPRPMTVDALETILRSAF